MFRYDLPLTVFKVVTCVAAAYRYDSTVGIALTWQWSMCDSVVRSHDYLCRRAYFVLETKKDPTKTKPKVTIMFLKWLINCSQLSFIKNI